MDRHSQHTRRKRCMTTQSRPTRSSRFTKMPSWMYTIPQTRTGRSLVLTASMALHQLFTLKQRPRQDPLQLQCRQQCQLDLNLLRNLTKPIPERRLRRVHLLVLRKRAQQLHWRASLRRRQAKAHQVRIARWLRLHYPHDRSILQKNPTKSSLRQTCLDGRRLSRSRLQSFNMHHLAPQNQPESSSRLHTIASPPITTTTEKPCAHQATFTCTMSTRWFRTWARTRRCLPLWVSMLPRASS